MTAIARIAIVNGLYKCQILETDTDDRVSQEWGIPCHMPVSYINHSLQSFVNLVIKKLEAEGTIVIDEYSSVLQKANEDVLLWQIEYKRRKKRRK